MFVQQTREDSSADSVGAFLIAIFKYFRSVERKRLSSTRDASEKTNSRGSFMLGPDRMNTQYGRFELLHTVECYA